MQKWRKYDKIAHNSNFINVPFNFKGEKEMTSFKIENVWICELVCVYRRELDNMLTLYESNSKCVLIMKEEARPPANVVHIKGQDYLLEQKAYFDLEGREYYHGTQKGVFTSSDIGKIFVSERNPVPENLLTEEEKETKMITVERIEELHRRLQFHNY